MSALLPGKLVPRPKEDPFQDAPVTGTIRGMLYLATDTA